MLVGHHVVFVLRIGRLVAIRHVDEVVRQLGGAVEFLSNAQRKEGFSVCSYGFRGEEREHREGGEEIPRRDRRSGLCAGARRSEKNLWTCKGISELLRAFLDRGSWIRK